LCTTFIYCLYFFNILFFVSPFLLYKYNRQCSVLVTCTLLIGKLINYTLRILLNMSFVCSYANVFVLFSV
jgi:hypothetical protein